MATYGLIGYPLSHSFSRDYFGRKFAELGLTATHRYLNFSMETVAGFDGLRDRFSDLAGCNVTIPHKRAIITKLDELDPVAAEIGAVNTIRFTADGHAVGYNTDYLGFRTDLTDQINRWSDGGATDFFTGGAALVLGTGGASLAIHAALRQLGMTTTAVSRSAGPDRLTYAALDADVLDHHRLLVNTTPLGMYPATETAPDLPYHLLTARHYCYDLVYNPVVTRFLQQAKGAGAGAGNGLGMLYGQAEAAWAIWTGGTTAR